MSQTAFVFDLDDTLYKERDYVASCFAFVGAAMAGRGHEGVAARLHALFAEGRPDPIADACAPLGLTPEEVRALVLEMRGHFPDIALRPDAAALLGALRERGLPYSIVTNGRGETQRRKIGALGLGDAASVSISGETGHAKPDPRAYEAAAAAHEGCRLVYVGDNPQKDFLAPNAMGWTTVMLRCDGSHIHAQAAVPEEAAPAMTIGRLTELLPLLES
ncbi:HAD family hydrolase [Parvularcula oceani]|uniref:HAD family hydrolase n=1 Tax=Parvularcula oceani TaxID=1247963 RepID=UPI00068E8AC8|nr:HAD family hydrolase [Parvularcula oceani]